jgi:hypothetical protein
MNVSHVSDVCCRSALCCNFSRCRKRMHVEAIPTGVVVPTCATSEEAGVGGPYLHAHQYVCARHAGATACGGGRAGAIVACGA